jgi:hypothetical protein
MDKAADKAFQRMASWQGQREKALFDSIGNLIEARLPKQASQPEENVTIEENPEAWARKIVPQILDDVLIQKTKAEQTFNASLIQETAALMEADPLFRDQTLGNEVVQEIQRNFGVAKGLNPKVGAELLVGKALREVTRHRSLAKTNPLAGNQPVKGPMGTVTAAPVKPNVKPVKLTEEAENLKKRFGYSEEDIARIFKE